MASLCFGSTPGEMGNPYGKCSSKVSKLETTIWAIRILLICLGIGSCVALLKAMVIPYASTFVVDMVPCMWNFGRVLFSPPYIYIIVNCIIMAIAASTSFHHQNNPGRKSEKTPPLLYSQKSQVLEMQFADKGEGMVEETPEVIKPMIIESSISSNISGARLGYNTSNPPVNPSNTSGTTLWNGSPAEESNKICPENESTLDSIWMAITDGHGKQPAAQLKKSGTWDTATRRVLNEAETGGVNGKAFRKSETFMERATATVVEEKSMGQDELKLRIEEFIRKNHDYLRLQREESQLRFVEAVNGGCIIIRR